MTKRSDKIDDSRRGFMAAAVGAGAVIVVAPGVIVHTLADAAPRAEAVTSNMRWGMLIDAGKCADGCDACVAACDAENGLDMQTMPEGADPALWDQQKAKWIRKVSVQDNLSGKVTNLVMLCQHCEHPPCVDVCPTGSSFKRADGIVLVDRHTCIGCRYCMMACPYKARSFIHERVTRNLTRAPRGIGCVESCNLCVHRRDNGESSTACAEACQSAGQGAIVFGDLKDPDSPVSQALKTLPNRQIRADLELNTGVRYSGI